MPKQTVFYLLTKPLPDDGPDQSHFLVDWIASELAKNWEHNKLFSTLESAQDTMFTNSSLGARKHCKPSIVQLSLDSLNGDKNIENLRGTLIKEPEKTNTINKSIEGIYIHAKFIPREYLSNKQEQENDHISRLDSDCFIKNVSQLQLQEPCSSYLFRFPEPLRYLFFIDYAQFESGENWISYDRREPGCIKDFFNAYTKILNDLDQPRKPLALEHIIELHRILSQSRFSEEARPRSGLIREDPYNCFMLSFGTVTKAGLVELIKRIQADNLPEGFALGRYDEFLNIISRCFSHLHCSDGSSFDESSFNESSIDSAVNSVLKEITEENKVTIKNDQQVEESCRQQIKQIFHSLLCEQEIDLKHVDDDCIFRLYCKSGNQQTKLEYDFTVALFRQQAYISLETVHDLSENAIDALAEEVIDKFKAGEQLALFSPHIQLAERLTAEAINRFNTAISEAKTPDELIYCCIMLTRELVRLHLFSDVNGRTAYMLLNQLLMRNGIKPCILYDPNRMDGFSDGEFFEEVKRGIALFQFIVDHKEEFLKINEASTRYFVRFYSDYRSAIASDVTELENYYKEIAQPLCDQIACSEKKHSLAMHKHSFITSQTTKCLPTTGYLVEEAIPENCKNTGPVCAFPKRYLIR
jgi:hypothetical protein